MGRQRNDKNNINKKKFEQGGGGCRIGQVIKYK